MITHPFKNKAHDMTALLDVQTIDKFCFNLTKQSKLFPDRIAPERYKGDGLEMLVEFLLKSSPVDSRLGISDYNTVSLHRDYGVDGAGIGTNGNPATVQVKFRASNKVLTANNARLCNFSSTSTLRFKVLPTDNMNMLVITTGKGLHHFTESEMFANKVRCIGRPELRKMLDNNLPFWNKLREEAI